MNNTSRIFSSVAALFLTLTVQSTLAGTATLTGFGEASAPTEFVTVTVRVSSECYPSALAASSANDTIANNVLKALTTRVQVDQNDQVTASGGFVERYTGYNPNNGQAVCIDQFRKQNLLILKTHSVSSFSQIFASLQDELYAMGMEMPRDAIDKPTSFLEMTAPVPGLSPTTLTALERKSLVTALKDAKEKFQTTLALAGITTYKIASYSEVGLNQRPLPVDVEKSHSTAGSAAPVQFGELTVSKTLQVQFQFEGGDLTPYFKNLLTFGNK